MQVYGDNTKKTAFQVGETFLREEKVSLTERSGQPAKGLKKSLQNFVTMCGKTVGCQNSKASDHRQRNG
jgi:hypothetical protein